MKQLNLQGSGNSMLVAMNAMFEALKTELTSYDNVQFVGTVEINGYSRYIFDVGLEKYYFTVEPKSWNQSGVYVSIFEKTQVNGSTFKSQFYFASTQTANYTINNYFYFFSHNNILHAFTGCQPTYNPADCVAWDNRFIYMPAQFYAFEDDSNATTRYILSAFPNVGMTQLEKAFECAAAITQANNNMSEFVAYSGVVHKIVNSQFNTMSFYLIDIDSERYRQVGAYMFINNGDDPE